MLKRWEAFKPLAHTVKRTQAQDENLDSQTHR